MAEKEQREAERKQREVEKEARKAEKQAEKEQQRQEKELQRQEREVGAHSECFKPLLDGKFLARLADVLGNGKFI